MTRLLLINIDKDLPALVDILKGEGHEVHFARGPIEVGRLLSNLDYHAIIWNQSGKLKGLKKDFDLILRKFSKIPLIVIQDSTPEPGAIEGEGIEIAIVEFQDVLNKIPKLVRTHVGEGLEESFKLEEAELDFRSVLRQGTEMFGNNNNDLEGDISGPMRFSPTGVMNEERDSLLGGKHREAPEVSTRPNRFLTGFKSLISKKHK